MLLSEAWGLRLMLQLSHATPYRPRPPKQGISGLVQGHLARVLWGELGSRRSKV